MQFSSAVKNGVLSFAGKGPELEITLSETSQAQKGRRHQFPLLQRMQNLKSTAHTARSCSSVIQCVLDMPEVLGSIPGMAKEEKKT